MDREGSMEGGRPSEEPAASPRCPTLASHHLLVVDDQRDIADSMGLVLRLLGAEVRVAYDGASALAICERWRPTDVLTDLAMPGIDGYEVPRRLRRRFRGEPLRLMAMSGWGQEDHRARAQAVGFDHYLVKPVSGQSLKAAIACGGSPSRGGGP
jgi:CheY-like chemotaxis protein